MPSLISNRKPSFQKKGRATRCHGVARIILQLMAPWVAQFVKFFLLYHVLDIDCDKDFDVAVGLSYFLNFFSSFFFFMKHFVCNTRDRLCPSPQLLLTRCRSGISPNRTVRKDLYLNGLVQASVPVGPAAAYL